MNTAGDWKAPWEALAEKVGTDLTNGALTAGADPIEASAVRRYLEPLEFDCPLHYDAEAARVYGHAGLTAPYTSVFTFTLPAMWEPGQQIFTSDDRNAQPANSPIDAGHLKVIPQATGLFVTDTEIDFFRPPQVGDHLSRRGSVLKSCVPKWTSVGRGAFITQESEVITESGEVIARIRNTVFVYEPVGPPPDKAGGAS